MTPRGFNRFMVMDDLGSNEKIGRFTDAEFRCLITGVWALAARAEPRGYLVVAGKPATAGDVARRGHCSQAIARSTLVKMRDLGMLETEDGLEHVHDWEEVQPAPKIDRTAPERQRRKRERDAQREAAKLVAASLSRRDNDRDNAVVTPPEVEVEVEVEDEAEVNYKAAPPAQPPPEKVNRYQEEARPPTAAPSLRVFVRWRDRCRRGSRNVQITEQREKAVASRIARDGFTIEQLEQAVDGAARAIEAGDLQDEHHDTELYRICMDREHVEAWMAYEETGDDYALQEVLLTEQSRHAAS